MADGEDLTSRIDSAEYLYFRGLREPLDNSLLMAVQEAVVNRDEPIEQYRTTSPTFEKLTKGAHPIESTPDCKTYLLAWDRYVAYLVTEEVVGSCGSYKDEAFTGRRFQRYTQSHLLDHVARDTGHHEKPPLHFKILCLNHLIDVVAYEEPTVTVLDPEPDLVASSKNKSIQ